MRSVTQSGRSGNSGSKRAARRVAAPSSASEANSSQRAASTSLTLISDLSTLLEFRYRRARVRDRRREHLSIVLHRPVRNDEVEGAPYPAVLPIFQQESWWGHASPCGTRARAMPCTSRYSQGEALPTRLILIRHGHTAANGGGRDQRLSGWTDLPLTERGCGQVHLLRLSLRGSSPFAAIYSSPLQRASETAKVLAQAGLGTLRLCAGLREINCGWLDGMALEEVQQRFPNLWRANLRQDDENFRWPGGESYRDFRRRCLSTMRTIAAAHRGRCVAVVTHAGVVSQVIGFISGTNAARWEQCRPGNTALTEIVWRGGSGVLVRFDDRSHLAREQDQADPQPAGGAVAESAPAGVCLPKHTQPVAC